MLKIIAIHILFMNCKSRVQNNLSRKALNFQVQKMPLDGMASGKTNIKHRNGMCPFDFFFDRGHPFVLTIKLQLYIYTF